MTDNEIIKALECCTSYDCEHCKYEPPTLVPKASLACNDALMKNALDLINRLKAENERLENSLAISKKETKRYTTRETLRIEFGKKKW